MKREYVSELNDIWAKSSKNNEKPETLVEHTQNVLNILKQTKKRNPLLPQIIDEQSFWNITFLSCLFHDIGKAAKSFQIQLCEGKIWKHRHEILSLAFIPEIISEDNEYFKWIVAGVVSHHKDAKEIIDERYNLLLEPEDIALDELKNELNERLVQSIFLWLKDIFLREIANNKINRIIPKNSINKVNIKKFCDNIPKNILIGLQKYNRLIHQIENVDYINKLNRIAIALRGIIMLSDHLASAHSPDLDSVRFPNRQELAKILDIPEDKLYSHQKTASVTEGSIILSAPTGSGKTETAILWAHNQQTVSKILKPLVYLLPYQASLNAIYKRFKEQFKYDIALIHGRSLQTLFREMLSSGYLPRNAEQEAKRAKELAILHQPSIWCTTPYHLLRAVYRLPGYETLWTNLSNTLIIVDEIHAYEPTRLGMFIELLFELKNKWGTNICTMTATMPSWLKKILATTLANKEILADTKLYQTFQRHRLEIVEGNILSDNSIEIVCKEFISGKSVLIGVNTVKTAQKVRDLLLEKQIDKNKIILIHSRFTIQDRLKKEEIIREKNKQNESLIVIATQVIEVSLNLDFDTIITEPAPLEAIIQRFGRVNRYGKKGIVSVRVLTESLDDERIYNKELVGRTLNVLKDNSGKEIDELEVNKWLNIVYSSIENEMIAETQKSRNEFRESCLHTLKAFNSNEDLSNKFDELFDNTEVLPYCLEEEFKRVYEISILEAYGLLVPVSWKYLYGFPARYDNKYRVKIIDASYDTEIGLLLSKTDKLNKAEII